MNSSFISISNNAVFRLSQESDSTNYLEAFDRLFLTLASINEYTVVDVEVIKKDFKDFYSLDLNSLFVSEFVNRLSTKGYIVKNKNDKARYFDREKVNNLNLKRDLEQIKEEMSLFINELVEFSSKNEYFLSNEQCEDILYRYIEESICSLSLKGYENNVSISSREKFLVDSFLKVIKTDNINLFSIFEKIIYARLYTAVIAQNDLTNNTVFTYKGMSVFLDSGFVFNALGMNYYIARDEYVEMINNLKNMGAKLFVFEHTFKEMRDLVENAIKWIDNPLFDQYHSSKTATYFVLSKTSRVDAYAILYSLKEKIIKLGISISDDLNLDYSDVEGIEITNLQNRIEEEYKKKGSFDDEKYDAYNNDAKSIYFIHKLRRKEVQRHFSDVKFIFLTNNSTLSKIAKSFNNEQFYNVGVPCVINDSLLNTLLWFESNRKNNTADLAILIPSIYHAFEPSKSLLKKMDEVFTFLRDNEKMSIEAIHEWKTNTAFQETVVLYTHNDPDNFLEDTPERILSSIKAKYTNAVKPVIESYEIQKTKILGNIKFRKVILTILLISLFIGFFVGFYFVLRVIINNPRLWWISIIIDGTIAVLSLLLSFFVDKIKTLILRLFNSIDKNIFNKNNYKKIEKLENNIKALFDVN